MNLLLVIVALIMTTIGVVVVILCAIRLRRWGAIGQMLSRRFGHGVSKPWLLEMILFGSPRFRFRYRGIGCYLKIRRAGFRKKDSPASISFAVDWPGRATSWLISTDPSDKRRWLEQPLSLPDASAFHRRFFLYGRHEKKVAGLLTPSVQHALLQMLVKSGPGRKESDGKATERLKLRAARRRLTFRRTTVSSDRREVEKFIRCCLHIYDLMVLGTVQGLTYLEDDLTVIEDVACPICSGPIETDFVSCSSCQTPHCRACWQYNGRCATFACMETDFVRAGVLAGGRSAQAVE